MSISKNWEVLPASDFAVQSSWRKIGKNRFFALRTRLLIVRTDGRPARDGSPTKSYPITPDTLSLRTMRQIVLSRTDTITQAIKFSVTMPVWSKGRISSSSKWTAHIRNSVYRDGQELPAGRRVFDDQRSSRIDRPNISSGWTR